MPLKKIFAVMFLFLMAVPAFAGTIVQGNNNFTYSSAIDSTITAAASGTFTSVDGSSFVLKDLNTLFPERLAAVAFSVSYTPAGKPAIMPGYLNLTFSESDIASFPNGALILQEIRNSSDPVSALFKYFDPTVLVYGPDGNLTAVNLKSMSSNFTLSSVDAGTMLLAAPIVPADGYPVTGFFVETVANYLLVYDAMVSQGSASKTGDGQIEFAFGLVPNGNVQASTFYPVIETNTGKGYVVFDDPSSLLDIPELYGFVPAEISSGSTVFSDVEGGFSFETACTPHGVSSVVVSLYVNAQTAQSLPDDFKVKVNGYSVSPSVTELPGGALYASVKFLLADGTFASDAFVSNDTLVLFDGAKDGRLTAEVKTEIPETPSRYVTYYHDRGSVKIDTQGVLPDEFRQVIPTGGSFSPAVISLLEGFTGQIAPVSLNVSYDNARENSAVTGVLEFTVFRSDVPSLQISSNAEALNYLRPVIGVKGVFFDVYDFLQKNGAESVMNISGSLDTGLTFYVPVIMADSAAFGISLGDQCLVIKDGSLDGKFLLETYVGILKKQQESKVVFNSEKIQLKTRNIILPDSYDIDMESDVDFEALDAEDWPGMDGVAGAVFAGGFTGSVSSGRGVSLTVSSSVTAAELKKMDKSRYDKMLTAWTAGEKSKFLSYYHLYKKINNDIYDLVLAGDKNIFTISGDPNSKIVISFPAVIVDGGNMVPVVYDESVGCFIIYDGNKDGKVSDPLFVGLPEITEEPEEGAGEEPEEEPEEEPKHILPDNPTGSSMGNDDLKDWIKVFSLF